MPPTFQHHRLPNNLTIIAETDPHAHSAAVGFFVRTGARDEDGELMGVSHFLEHMMFKGTAARSAEDVDRDFDAIGADHNAYTTSEMTAFYAHCLPERLDEAEEVLADILRPAIRQADFDAEKKVILEEIAMYQDQPFWVLYERLMEEHYGTHPLSHRVLGTERTIGGLARDQMQGYFDHRYAADNTVVALAGRLDFDAMVGRLERHCGGWSASGVTRRYPDARFSAGDFTVSSPTAHQHYVLMSSPGPGARDDRRYAMSILMSILGGAEGSRLYWALVETGLADEAQAQYESHDGIGEQLVFAACSVENGALVEQTILHEIRNLRDSLTDDDLLRVRSKIATGATLQGELPAGRMRRLGRIWTYLGEYRSLEQELERIDRVTLEELRDVADAFPMDHLMIGRLVP